MDHLVENHDGRLPLLVGRGEGWGWGVFQLNKLRLIDNQFFGFLSGIERTCAFASREDARPRTRINPC